MSPRIHRHALIGSDLRSQTLWNSRPHIQTWSSEARLAGEVAAVASNPLDSSLPGGGPGPVYVESHHSANSPSTSHVSSQQRSWKYTIWSDPVVLQQQHSSEVGPGSVAGHAADPMVQAVLDAALQAGEASLLVLLRVVPCADSDRVAYRLCHLERLLPQQPRVLQHLPQ